MTMPLTLDQVIYRGSTIRNTVRTIGIVINTGEECKIRKNSKRETRPKKPALEITTNYIVLFLMMYVLISSSAATVAYLVWKGAQERFAWYLSDTTIPFGDIFVGFIIMFNNVIPLSLYVGLEAIKLGQMSLISGDLQMYHDESDTPAGVNTTNNLDDLGQISYVFSDKTGTLTENIMKLRMISIAGTSWLHNMDNKNETTAFGYGTASGMSTEDMLDYIRSQPNTPFAAKAIRYILAMALCHTCLPERAEDGRMDFQASSPDELALVRGARDLGFVVTHRSSQSVTVQIPHQDGGSSSTTYEILDLIEFTSKRKRMSVVVRCPDGRLWLICKGADSIMLPRLRMAPTDMQGRHNSLGGPPPPELKSSSSWMNRRPQQMNGIVEEVEETASSTYSRASLPTSDSWIPLRSRPTQADELRNNSPMQVRDYSFLETTDVSDDAHAIRECFAHIDHYATEGLRTLVYADKFLDATDYENWKRLYREAETSLDDRQERIEEVGELLEQNLELVGASAVEDKLQDGVPETIEKLRQAGIKVWMLTGDKRETAINIAHSTRLCGPESTIHVLDVLEGDLELQITNIADAIQYRVETVYSDPSRSHTAIVVDGETLTAIENPSADCLRRLFTQVVTAVDSVICCRASPAQKALLVNMVRKGPLPAGKPGFFSFSWLKPRPRGPITLAIGDGANDVAMITAANVGVGISGREGQQAARTADFSISQFRFLTRLVLVHGRWNYHRTTRFILATFWKETFIFFPQALFQVQTGATGTSLYEPGSLTFVSFFTAATILIIGTWEQDLAARTLVVIPELFKYGQNGEGLNAKVYLRWFCNALIAGTIVYAGCWAGYAGSELIDDAGLYAQGALTFIVCVIWINIKLLIVELHHKTTVVLWSILGSITGIWAYALVVSAISGPSAGPYSIRGGLLNTFGRDPAWWCAAIMAVGALLLMEMLSSTLLQNHALRTWFSRCWSSSASANKRRGGGVREGFNPWEPRLWQEMEKDPAVKVTMDRLWRQEFGKLGDRRMFGQEA
ncbi:hypothetical protein F5883DRAFT_543640 [Diaporthe sp. PMI_573]|nr:hypothetical protein F5883DRAFT_543640 [Diaporthaceae sp. PMI_573]